LLLKYSRLFAGFGLREWAKRCGVSPSSYCDAENGDGDLSEDEAERVLNTLEAERKKQCHPAPASEPTGELPDKPGAWDRGGIIVIVHDRPGKGLWATFASGCDCPIRGLTPGGWSQLLPASAEPTGELPTGPGVWKREGDLWLAEFVLEKLESLIGASQIDMRRGILGEFVDQDKLPRGGWTQLLPANAELRAELASVTAERDGLKILNRTYGHNVSELAKNCDDLEARAGLAESQLTALRERLERAEGALAELEKLATVRERHKIWSALKAIANAEQKWVSGVGSYAGGETNAGFACRLQNIARTALQGATQ
jgi:hypothetical protein